MADLFDLDDLRKALRLTVSQFDIAAATVARRRASGWLMSPTGLTTWPDTIPDNLWGWAIELAAIAYRNPASASNESVDDYQVSWDRQRRAEILEEARIGYGAGSPVYSFPTPDWHWAATTDATTITTD